MVVPGFAYPSVVADFISGGVTSIGAPANGLLITGNVLTIAQADGSHIGALSAADWTAFNSKQTALTFGNLTDTGTDGITIGSGTGAVIGSGTTISQHVADASHNGYLSSSDWSAFNAKQAAGNYITALTGEVTASGPGSVAATIAGKGTVTESTSSILTLTGWANATLGSPTIQVKQASGSQSGYLSSADWTTFNTAASNTPNPQTMLGPLEDHFFVASTAQVGFLGWKSAVSGTGASVLNNANGVSFAGHPGVIGLNNGTSTTGSAQIYLGNNERPLSDGAINCEWYINIQSLSNATNRFTLSVGLFTGIAGTVGTDGVYFTYNDNVNSGNWVLNVTKSGVVTSSNTSTAMVAGANTWVKLQITTNAAGTSATFFINGVNVGTLNGAGTLPTAGLQFGALTAKSAGIVNEPLYIDYFRGSQLLNTPLP